MIEFVAYFSTAQDHLGYVVLDGHGVFDSGLVGGPELPKGLYRIENGALIAVDTGEGANH